MRPILTADQMRRADRTAIDKFGIASAALMENAARGAWQMLRPLLGATSRRIAILCGGGNNGGDGIAMARHAVNADYDVRVVLLVDVARLSEECSRQYNTFIRMMPEQVLSWDGFLASDFYPDVVVDAMLGTGTTGPPRDAIDTALEWCEKFQGIRFAVDIPSGIDSNTGSSAGRYFHADATATMGALKLGLLLKTGTECSGTVGVVDIGAPAHIYANADIALLDSNTARGMLQPIQRDRHKFDRGRLLILAGSRGMSGAAVMTASAALRAGAGLVVLGLPERALDTLPQILPPEIMTLPLPSDGHGEFAADAFDQLIEEAKNYNAIAIGPGMSRGAGTADAVARLVATSRAPIVLDADGLTHWNGNPAGLAGHASPVVITPHHGEMARLNGTSSAVVAADPLETARTAADTTRCIVVLKGAPSILAASGLRTLINGAGNPGMATAGSGDVLTGVIAGLMAGGLDAATSATLGLYLHSCAGDIAATRYGVRSMIASDIVEAIPAAYASLEVE